MVFAITMFSLGALLVAYAEECALGLTEFFMRLPDELYPFLARKRRQAGYPPLKRASMWRLPNPEAHFRSRFYLFRILGIAFIVVAVLLLLHA